MRTNSHKKNYKNQTKKKQSALSQRFFRLLGIMHALYSVSLSFLFGLYFLPIHQLVGPSQATLAAHDTTHHDIVQQLRSESSYSSFPETSSQIIFHGDRMFPKVALTFDADMTKGMEEMLASGQVQSFYDDKLIQLLETTHTKATLFLTGMWIETYPEVTKELAQNPLFELANHSYDHRGMDGTCYGLAPATDAEDITEVAQTQRLLENVGVKNFYFRFPGGCYSQTDLDILSKIGITAIQWDVAGIDGFNDDEANIEDNVLGHVQNGSIIVMHMNGAPNEPKTADATAHIIAQLKRRGFQFVTVSELLEQ